MKKPFDVNVVVPLLFDHVQQLTGKDYRRGFRRADPYRVLVSTIIGLQTRGVVAHRVSEALWDMAHTPQDILAMSVEELAGVLTSSGRSLHKSQHIQAATRMIRDKFDGRVPSTMEELLLLPGVGRKVANLVLEIGYGIPSMCVDTHVHRINNHWGWMHTRSPNETEAVLRERLPRTLWQGFNPMLVTFGNKVCWPTSPKCSQCPVVDYCEQRGVSRKR